MKGKHSSAAAARRVREDAEERATRAEARVASLEATLERLRADHESVEAALRRDLKTAQEERDDGASPALAAERAESERLRGEIKALHESAARIRDNWDRLYKRMHRHLVREDKMLPGEAAEVLLQWAVGNDGVRLNLLDEKTHDLSLDAVLQIQQVRRLRRSGLAKELKAIDNSSYMTEEIPEGTRIGHVPGSAWVPTRAELRQRARDRGETE